MPHAETHLDKTRRMLINGLCPLTIRTTATTIWGLSFEEADQLIKKTMKMLALEATALDTLGELMLTYRRQEHLYDQMTRQQTRVWSPAPKIWWNILWII